MLSCEEVSRLVSESMDNNQLTFWQRVQVRLHLLMCSLCSRFRQQAQFLRQATQRYSSVPAEDKPGPQLSEAARKRIKKALKTDS